MAVCCTRKKRVVDLAPLLDRVPTSQYADRCQQTGEHDQPETQAIHADVIEDRRILNPDMIDLELKTVGTGDEVRRKMKRQAEAEERGEKRNPIRQLTAVGQ